MSSFAQQVSELKTIDAEAKVTVCASCAAEPMHTCQCSFPCPCEIVRDVWIILHRTKTKAEIQQMLAGCVARALAKFDTETLGTPKK